MRATVVADDDGTDDDDPSPPDPPEQAARAASAQTAIGLGWRWRGVAELLRPTPVTGPDPS